MITVINTKNDLFKFLEEKLYEYNGKNGKIEDYIKPFILLYNEDKPLEGSVTDNIINYFINNYCTDINYNLITLIEDKFEDYLYSLGFSIGLDYECKRHQVMVYHVVSQFIMNIDINLVDLLPRFYKQYGVRDKNVAINIINWFMYKCVRPWKRQSDYEYEFHIFYNKLADKVIPKFNTYVQYDYFKQLINKYYNTDIAHQSETVLDGAMTMWRIYFGQAWTNNQLTPKEIKNIKNPEVIRDYFIREYYQDWKDEYDYEHEWKDYMEMLSLD